MPPEGQIKARLERALGFVEDHGVRGTRLLDDGNRLAARVRRFIQMGMIPADTDATALDLACLALQLPLKAIRSTPSGRVARPSLRERAEQAAEMLVGMMGGGDWRDNGGTDAEALVEETTRLLVEVRQRNPESAVARLLADAINLEDFGVIGLVEQAIAITRQGGGVSQVADGCEKREQYGYWEARLKDGFHFDQTRAIAKKRLDHTRRVAGLLMAELREDGAL
jgi:hypothetical protein